VLTIIIAGLFVVITCVFPVAFMAKKLGAEKIKLMDCFLAIIVASIAIGLTVPLLPGGSTSDGLYFIYSLLVAGVVYKYMLQATYIASVVIALISTLITTLILYLIDKILT